MSLKVLTVDVKHVKQNQIRIFSEQDHIQKQLRKPEFLQPGLINYTFNYVYEVLPNLEN